MGVKAGALLLLIMYFSIFSGGLRVLMCHKGVHGEITLVNAGLKQLNHNICLVNDPSL